MIPISWDFVKLLWKVHLKFIQIPCSSHKFRAIVYCLLIAINIFHTLVNCHSWKQAQLFNTPLGSTKTQKITSKVLEQGLRYSWDSHKNKWIDWQQKHHHEKRCEYRSFKISVGLRVDNAEHGRNGEKISSLSLKILGPRMVKWNSYQ